MLTWFRFIVSVDIKLHFYAIIDHYVYLAKKPPCFLFLTRILLRFWSTSTSHYCLIESNHFLLCPKTCQMWERSIFRMMMMLLNFWANDHLQMKIEKYLLAVTMQSVRTQTANSFLMLSDEIFHFQYEVYFLRHKFISLLNLFKMPISTIQYLYLDRICIIICNQWKETVPTLQFTDL